MGKQEYIRRGALSQVFRHTIAHAPVRIILPLISFFIEGSQQVFCSAARQAFNRHRAVVSLL
jgi:hypothetical protein